MKILQILPGFTLGGPTFSTTTLTRYIQKSGHQVMFFTESSDFTGYEDIDIHAFKTLKFPYNKQFAFSYGLYRELEKECRDAQIVQTNSLWQFPNIVQEFARRGSNAKSVIVPRGTLSEYALTRATTKKKIALVLGQRMALNKADMFIATCEKEYHDIRKFGLMQPVAIIPNGLELPSLKIDRNKEKIIVFLARIHKVKGVDFLIKAWRDIQNSDECADWNLKIAGPLDSTYAQQMLSLASKLVCERISFVGEIFGGAKYDFLSEASIYVLPTHTENFGITVAEALACETPVITTTGTPWAGLATHKCGMCIDLSQENLKDAMIEMMRKSEGELVEMGRKGREWISQDFTWHEIADKTIRSYEWLLNPIEEDKPDWIVLD